MDLLPETFQALLTYLTTGQLPTSSDSLLQLLVLVDKYGVSEAQPPPPYPSQPTVRCVGGGAWNGNLFRGKGFWVGFVLVC